MPDEQRESFAAVIKHNFQKKGKGKGKGKKGGGKGEEGRQSGKGPGPENKCHECGSEQHFKRDCPVHIAKVECKGKGKGKGGMQWPSQRAWKDMYPGPSKGQWGNLWPGNGEKGAGKAEKGGAANAFTQGTALDALKAAGLYLNTFTEIPAKKQPSEG